MIELLKEMCEAAAIPGREQALIDIMVRELKKTTDNVEVDQMGNVIGIKKSKSQNKNVPTIMIAGHMDEIGFIVNHIDKNGMIRFAPRGGHIPKVLISQRVRIIGEKTELVGIVEGLPPFLKKEEMNKVAELKDLFIDTGLSEKELRKQVRVGDMIVLDRGLLEQGQSLISKAFDNRVGCYIVLEAMKKLAGKKLPINIYAVGTAQEEVGIRGAMMAARHIQPDIGIALDITGAYDVPGVSDYQQVTGLGKGAAIKINDNASISNYGIVKYLEKLAKKSKIKHQLEVLPFGGTDAAGMQRFGKGPVCTISVPTRYAHTPNEMINKKDLKACIDLLVSFLEHADKCNLEF